MTIDSQSCVPLEATCSWGFSNYEKEAEVPDNGNDVKFMHLVKGQLTFPNSDFKLRLGLMVLTACNGIKTIAFYTFFKRVVHPSDFENKRFPLKRLPYQWTFSNIQSTNKG